VKKKILYRARSAYPRLDHFLADVLEGFSRSRVEKLISYGHVTIDGRGAARKSEAVPAGAVAEIEIDTGDEQVRSEPPPPLIKLFEDEWLLVIDKPAGMTVHPGAGETGPTVLDLFRFYYPQISEMSGSERPGIVHRLDKDTSGVLLLAKDEKTMGLLQRQFAERDVQKTYLALVCGAMRFLNGTIDLPLLRDPRRPTRFIARRRVGGEAAAREAVTDYSVVLQRPAFSLLRVQPRTGRTHQIRVHLAAQGNPVLGDAWYGRRGQNGPAYPGLALHASTLAFTHPHSGLRIKTGSPMPAVMRQFLRRELSHR
jgi:23S rRNA pseudouridine1911/1915/1917 synthase